MSFGANIGASSVRRDGAGVVGDFRILLTLGPSARVRDPRVLDEWAHRQGFTLDHGLLDRGRTPCRPVLSVEGSGDLPSQRATAERWAARLRDLGYRVARTRIEAAPWNDGVPQTDAEAEAEGLTHCHFTHRVTVRLRIPYDTRRLAATAGKHAAGLSRLVRKVPSRGVQERVVVQCVRGAGRTTARGRLEELLDGLLSCGFRAVDVEEVYVVHDDNPVADAGWYAES
jgi:hypothetical protein